MKKIIFTTILFCAVFFTPQMMRAQVHAGNAAKPTISAQPQSVTVSIGSTPTLSVTASVSDGGTLSYQWYSNNTNSTTGGTAISGATNSSYTLPKLTTAGTLYFYVVVTNTNTWVSGNKTAPVASNVATVTVLAPVLNAATPTISDQPKDVTANRGDTPTLSVTASVSDGGMLSYQWYLNFTKSNSGGAPITGATSSSYTIPTMNITAGVYYFYVVVTNTNSNATNNKTATTTSNVATVTVNAAPLVCSIGTTPYTSLDDALTAVKTGQTIKLLTNIDYTKSISIFGINIIFDMNGHTLNVVFPGYNGLVVARDGSVTLKDPTNGEFNVTGGAFGVHTDSGGKAVVTNATASGSDGGSAVLADGAGCYIEVLKDVAGKALKNGVIAQNGGSVLVGGNVFGDGYSGVYTEGANSSITVKGNVTSIKGSSSIGSGAVARGGDIVILGNVTGAYYGVEASVGGTITVNGTVAGSNGYIMVGTTPKTQAQYEAVTTKTGYFTYTDDGANTVWVKSTGAGPTITTTSLPNGTVGTAYNQTLQATGDKPITWTVSAGSLPGGLSLATTTGTISGTPTASGTFSFTVQAANATAIVQKALSIVIAAAPTYTISASTLTSFGSKQIPYTQPAAQTVTVTNTGTGSVTLNQPTATNYIIGTLSTTALAAGAKATFTVQPKANLAAGNYNETISISGTGGTSEKVAVSAKVDASFTVAGGTAIETVSQATGLKAWVQNGTLHVSGLTAGKPCRVYTVTGVLVTSPSPSKGGEEVTTSLPGHGLYIVQSGNWTVKVMSEP